MSMLELLRIFESFFAHGTAQWSQTLPHRCFESNHVHRCLALLSCDSASEEQSVGVLVDMGDLSPGRGWPGDQRRK
jgi:hypothetical protein